MTIAKATALIAGFVGAFALGVVVGPLVKDGAARTAPQSTQVIAEETPAPFAASRRANAPRPQRGAARSDTAESVVGITDFRLSDPRLHDRVRPLLNRGASIDIAAEGFESAEEFAMVAHAARNTNVPFMVLKHRVVTEGRPLADAIHDVKPDVDTKAEVTRARIAAKSDLAALEG